VGKAWPVWRERRRVLVVIAVVEPLAIAVPATSWVPLSKAHLALASLLTSLSVTYSLCVVGWERARRHLLLERTPAVQPNVLATWCFAAAIMLPPALAAGVTAISVLADWPAYNAAGTNKFYRYVYSLMTSVLAATTASHTLRLGLPTAATLPLAAAAWLLVSYGLIALAMCASGQLQEARSMLHLDAYRLEVVTMAAAVAEYAVHRAGLPLICLSLPAAVVIQRRFTKAELRLRGSGAPPMSDDAWLHVAGVVVEASVAVTVLRIDASDTRAASLVAMMQGGCDAIGTHPSGGLAILLPDCPPGNGDALNRRLRIAMEHHKVDCHVVSASKPRDGQTLGDLLAICEAELVVSREAAHRSEYVPPAQW
jgi:hypothetical protein